MRRDKTNTKRVFFFKRKGPALKKAKSFVTPKIYLTDNIYSEKERVESEIRHKMAILIRIIRDQVDESDYTDPEDRMLVMQYRNKEKEVVYRELENLDKQLYSS